jgi:glycosidase
MLLLTLRGTPTIYYGDEIGIAQVPIPPDRIHDPLEKKSSGSRFGALGLVLSGQVIGYFGIVVIVWLNAVVPRLLRK